MSPRFSRTRRRAFHTLGAFLAIVLLAACSGIPTTGPVRAGDGGVATPEPVLPILQGPQPGDDARSIMQGFLTASAGGAVTGFDTAREYLASDAAVEWEPLQKVTIFDSRTFDPEVDEETGTVTYRLPIAAIVDESGVMTESAPEVRQDVTFTVEPTESGEYRITSLEDGIIISVANFVRYFRDVELIFATEDLEVETPDVRWFANNDQIATVAARELIEGPSAWLTDAVVTGFPATSSLALDAVVVEDGVAHVSLAAGSAGTAQERALAAEQMSETLTQITSVASVETTVGGVPLTLSEVSQLADAPLPDASAAVNAGGRFGLWDGESIAVDDAGALPQGARGLALAYDLGLAAFVTDEGLWVTTAPAQREDFEPYDDSAPAPEETTDAVVLVSGSNLLPPSFDRHGWVWTGPAATLGILYAAPAAGTQDDVVEIAVPWLVGRQINAIAVSRDGARIAILSRVQQQQYLEVAAVVRDASGTPLSIGSPVTLAPSVRPSIDVAWTTTVDIVALGETAGDITQVMVGGRTADISALSGATGFTARFGDRTLVAVTDAGELQVRSGNSWARRAEGVWDVAYAG